MTSSPRPTATLVSTSDRYDLQWERETLRDLPDLDVALVSGLPTSDAELVALARDADGVLFSSREAMTAATFAALPSLRVVCRYAVGLDHVDLEAATEHGVVVSHCPGYCTPEVADHALGLILALNRNIVSFDRHLRAGAWREHTHHMDRLLPGPIPAMRTLTIGVVGFGRIGRSVVERLRPFDCRVVVADPFVGEEDGDPLIVRQRGQGPLQDAGKLDPGGEGLGVLLGACLAGPLRLDLERLGIQRVCRTTALGPEHVVAAVGRDPHQPRPDEAAMERGDGRPGPDERVLRSVLGGGRVAQHPEAQSVHGPLVAADDGVEGREVAALRVVKKPLVQAGLVVELREERRCLAGGGALIPS